MTKCAPKFSVSAPGKAILFGEHAVVYGKHAVAAAVDLRTTLTVSPSESGNVQFSLPDLELSCSFALADLALCFPPTEISLLSLDPHLMSIISATVDQKLKSFQKTALTIFLYLYCAYFRESRHPYEFHICSAIPVGSGLGSSAAFSVVLATAMYYIKEQKLQISQLDKASLYQISFLAEKIAHGNPSGIDNTVSINGGLLVYKLGEFRPLPVTSKLAFAIIDTRLPRDAKSQVQKVRELKERFPEKIDAVINEINEVALSALDILQDPVDRSAELKRLIDRNQALLEDLDVSNDTIRQIVDIGKRHGISCKITGAGGGGCIIALLEGKNGGPFMKELDERGIRWFGACLDGSGVQITH